MLLSHGPVILAELGRDVGPSDQNPEKSDSMLPDASLGEGYGNAGDIAAPHPILSADLQAQINHIECLTRLLANSDLNPEQHAIVRMVLDEATALSSKISALDDRAQGDYNASCIVAEPFDLTTFIDDVELIFSAQARGKALDFNIHIQEDLPTTLQGDISRLRQIVSHVMAQIVTQTAHGTLSLHISADIVDADEQLSIAIESEASSAMPLPQNGSFSETLLSLMGGTMHVQESETEGRITTIALTLPLPVEEDDMSKITEPLKGARVLLLASDSQDNEDLSKQLSDWGLDACRVDQAAIASTFLQAANKVQAGIDILLAEQSLFQDYITSAGLDDALAAFDKHRIILFASPDALADADFSQLQGYAACLTEPLDNESFLMAMRDVVVTASVETTISEATPVDQTELVEDAPEKKTRMQIAPPSLMPSEEELHAPFDQVPETPMQFDTLSFDIASARVPVVAAPSDTSVSLVPPVALGGRVDVLIAEDNEINQLVYGQILSKLFVSYRIVDNADALFNVFEALNPRMVLLDISLPDMTGYDVAQKLRDSGTLWGANVPIIGVIAPGNGEDYDSCIAARMDDCVSKPVSPKTLLSKIEYWLDRSADQSSVA